MIADSIYRSFARDTEMTQEWRDTRLDICEDWEGPSRRPGLLLRPPDPFETGCASALVDLEGWSETPYQCSEDAWTIGYGHRLDAYEDKFGVDEIIVLDRCAGALLLLFDIRLAEHRASQNWTTEVESRGGPYWSDTDRIGGARRQGLVEMAFQLGRRGQLGFSRMWDALAEDQWETAALEATRSKWFRQTPKRAVRVSTMLRLDSDPHPTVRATPDPFLPWRS